MHRFHALSVVVLTSFVGVACDGADEGIKRDVGSDAGDGGVREGNEDGGVPGADAARDTTSTTTAAGASTDGASEAETTAGSSDTAGTQVTGASITSTAETRTDATSTGVTNSSQQTTDDPIPGGTVVGVGCTQDSDCDAPTTCVRTHESFSGAFPGTGICTMPCETNDDCAAVDVYAFCQYVGHASDETIANTPDGELPAGFGPICMLACVFGQPDEHKCDGLSTFTCLPVDDVVRVDASGEYEFMLGACTAMCHADSDCETGEVCDQYWGLCVEDEPTGKDIGESCDVNAVESECASRWCIQIAEELDTGFCSAPCNVHPDTTVCGGEPSTTAGAGCYPNLFGPLPSSVGDFGQCIPLCDRDADCPTGLACDLTSPDSLEAYGRPGICFPTDESIAQAVEGSSNGQDAGLADASVSGDDAAIDASTGDDEPIDARAESSSVVADAD